MNESRIGVVKKAKKNVINTLIFNAKIFKMKERLLSFLEFIEEKNAVFEKKAGLSNGFVNNIGDNVRKNTIKKIKTAYPQFNTDWWETGVGNMINETNNSEIGSHSKKSINSNIKDVTGNVIISANEFDNMIELQKGYQEIQKELTNRLKTSQEQLSVSQEQINVLLDIIKNK